MMQSIQILARRAFLSAPSRLAIRSRPVQARLYHRQTIGLRCAQLIPQRRWASDTSASNSPEEVVSEAVEETSSSALHPGEGATTKETFDFAEVTPAAEQEHNAAAQEGASSGSAPTTFGETLAAGADSSAAAQLKYTSSPQQNENARPSYEQKPPAAPNNILFVSNLFFELKEEDIRAVFEKYGEIVSLTIAKDLRGMSKGFAHVEFKDIETATTALEAENFARLAGRPMAISFHKPPLYQKRNVRQPRTNNEPTNSLFIGNMSFSMTDKDLNELFRPFKGVKEIRVAMDRRTGQLRGFIHVDFTDVESATTAKEQLTGRELFGRPIRVDYSMQRHDRPQPPTSPEL